MPRFETDLNAQKPYTHEKPENDMPYAAVDVASCLVLKFPLRPLSSSQEQEIGQNGRAKGEGQDVE
nr:hypothetical protein [Mesorhizobium loti]